MGFTINRSQDRQGETKQPMVTIYFIGVNLMKGADKKVPPTIVVGGHGPRRMPQIGESMVVPANVARIIEKQTMTWHPETQEPIPGVTTNAQYAALVKSAYESGKPLAQEVAEQAVSNVPDSVLRAMYEKRFGPVETPVYEDGKQKRSDPAVDGEIVYMDELPEVQEHLNEEVVYQDEAAESKTQPKNKRSAKGDN
jgi:hypothetical protein